MAPDPYRYFRLEGRELLDHLGQGILEVERDGGVDVVQRMLRHAHTLKGAARVVRQPEIADHAHAIEDALAPLRDGSVRPTRDRITTVLGLLDQIEQRLAALALPVVPAVPATKTAPVMIEEPVRSVRAELAEMDELLDAVMETHTQLGAVRASVALAEETRELAELVADQLAPRDGARHRIHELATQLRDRSRTLARTLGVAVEHVERELVQVRDVTEHLRLVPAQSMFAFLDRAIRDTGHSLDKQVELSTVGGDIRLDAHVLHAIQSALVQLVRNAVAHGIELPAQRIAAGKPAVGRVTVTVARRGRRIAFACRDDGNGIDIEGVRRAALRRGMAATAAEAGVDAIMVMLLRGGITTSPSVTEVSGRGIGLDVVREAVDRLGGDVGVVSESGRGTTFELVVPLSLASVETLVVEASGVAAIIPLEAIKRTLRIAERDVSRSGDGESIMADGKVIPFMPLARALRIDEPQSRRHWSTVIVDGAGGAAAIGVDRMRGTATVVVRPVPEAARATAAIAGAALDAQGNPQLVLDTDGLVAEARVRGAAPLAAEAPRVAILVVDDSLTTRMLEQSILESAGYDVDTAVSGEQGLDRARARRYALFLVDVEMPGIDGFTFIERVRADPALRDTPAILVTSRSSADDRKRGEVVGAQGFIVKSEFDQVELLASIERLVR